MDYEMRAEYADGRSPRDAESRFEVWHMTRVGEAIGLCGRDLAPDAVTQPATAWGTEAGRPLCHACGALYIHQVR
ncbi:hypothetical protein [Streptomyces corynorhini]|uniref:Uncharacterized protein n=1 Tax=Streptomyces corynorhini TaxID=2282652 RepID=A0A370B0Y3_9ACTN|nr:hypothetical protein [Streptomyces corynorhini]RDG35490.1 hypothetical protein DVH02_25125 [Streptomyces corynorhini]